MDQGRPLCSIRSSLASLAFPPAHGTISMPTIEMKTTCEARAGLQISLLPLCARPILSRVGPSTHPTHGIAGLTQVLHHQAAQSSRAAGHQNMLHVTILSCFSVLCMPLSEARTGDKRARADVTLLWLSLSCYGLTIREKEKGEQWTNPGERGTREKRSSTIACCSFPLPIG